jgi:hypothetical protein
MSFESEYRDLVIKQYWDKPKARAEIELLAKSYGRTFEWLESFLAEFDVDLATGERLDIIGRLVGVNRSVPFVIEKIAFGFADKAQRRYFIDFNGTDASMELSSPFQPAGDFEIELDFSTTETSGFPVLITTSDSGVDGILLYMSGSSGLVFLRTAVSSTVFNIHSGVISNDGKLHTVKIRRIVDDFYISMDGGAEATTNQPVTIADFTEIGSNDGASYFGGVIASAKLNDLDTPTNSLLFALDQATGTSESSSINSGALTYVNISESSREVYELLTGQWNNLFYPNLLAYSEQFENWNKSGSSTTTTNVIAAPDGSITADLLDDTDTVGNRSYWDQVFTITEDLVERTFSIYLKEGSAPVTEIQIIYFLGTTRSISAKITWSNHTVTGGTLESVGDGWYRLSASQNNNSSGNTQVYARLFPATNSAGLTGSVYAWGGQLEEGSVATTYKKTTDVPSKSLVIAE